MPPGQNMTEFLRVQEDMVLRVGYMMRTFLHLFGDIVGIGFSVPERKKRVDYVGYHQHFPFLDLETFC
jgi:hypothetical protein